MEKTENTEDTKCVGKAKQPQRRSSKSQLQAAQEENADESPTVVKTEPSRPTPYILNGELYAVTHQIGDFVKVKCIHCPSDREYRGSIRSTGNFHMHIKRRHPELMNKLHEMKVQALLERRERTSRVRKRNVRKETQQQDDSAVTTPTATPASLMSAEQSEVHDLKIKRVFKQHEQQAAQQTNSSSDTENAVLPFVQQQQLNVIFHDLQMPRSAAARQPVAQGSSYAANSPFVFQNLKLEPMHSDDAIDLTVRKAATLRNADSGITSASASATVALGSDDRTVADCLAGIERQLRILTDITKKNYELKLKKNSNQL